MRERLKRVIGMAMTAVGLAALLGSGPARAQTAPEPGQPYQVRGPADWRPPSGVGTAVLVGGGVGDFTGDSPAGAVGPAGTWNLRLVSGTRTPIGAELAYTGGLNPLDGTATDDDYLLQNGVEAVLRLGVPLPVRSFLIAPFAFGGAGWNRYDLTNAGPDRGALRDHDNLLVVPMGLGLASAYRGVMLDARGTYRQAFDDDLFGGDDMSTWAVTLNLGGEF